MRRCAPVTPTSHLHRHNDPADLVGIQHRSCRLLRGPEVEISIDSKVVFEDTPARFGNGEAWMHFGTAVDVTLAHDIATR